MFAKMFEAPFKQKEKEQKAFGMKLEQTVCCTQTTCLARKLLDITAILLVFFQAQTH